MILKSRTEQLQHKDLWVLVSNPWASCQQHQSSLTFVTIMVYLGDLRWDQWSHRKCNTACRLDLFPSAGCLISLSWLTEVTEVAGQPHCPIDPVTSDPPFSWRRQLKRDRWGLLQALFLKPVLRVKAAVIHHGPPLRCTYRARQPWTPQLVSSPGKLAA